MAAAPQLLPPPEASTKKKDPEQGHLFEDDVRTYLDKREGIADKMTALKQQRDNLDATMVRSLQTDKRDYFVVETDEGKMELALIPRLRVRKSKHAANRKKSAK